MINPPLEKELLNHLRQLNVSQQVMILDYVRFLASQGDSLPEGAPAEQVIEAAKDLFDELDIKEIATAIEEDCERIDVNEW